MIGGMWKDPNFHCKVTDDDGNTYLYVTYAASEEQLRERLERKDMTVLRIKPYDFQRWLLRAERVLKKLSCATSRKERKEIFDSSPLWQELKRHLFDLFHGMCAYCDGKPLLGSSGDVEHFRPKQRVAEEASHFGYFWLAYSPDNLLPACENCNRVRGKLTQFPVESGTRAYDSQTLAGEKPLLLTPYEESFHPRDHFSFEKGKAVGLSPRGKKSVNVYNLNRSGLGEERRQEQEFVVQQWFVKSNLLLSFSEAKKVVVKKILQGDRPYPAAALDELERVVRREVEALSDSAA